MLEETVAGSDPRAAPRLIVPMSLQLVIPRRVALQQSSPPLHQPSVILKEKRKFEKEKLLNCMCANFKLSQQKGSPQMPVPMLSAKDTSCRNQVQTLAKGLFQVSSISLTILIRSRRSTGGIGSFTSTGRIRRSTIPGTAITSKRSRT